MTKALYPGSFDPVTNGHLDIATRAALIFDELIMGVFATPSKNLLFSTEERVDLVAQSVSHIPNIHVTTYTGLTVSFAKQIGAGVMVRGLRAITDFNAEFELALMNRLLWPQVETMCLMTDRAYQFVSSSLLKEACQLGGDVTSLVPPHVLQALYRKYAARRT
jgi:pantetheine-phosphate adenylyltransferase